jgi:hypothetical protein
MKDRKAYFKWYNRHVRGRPEPKQRHRWQCVFCGFMSPNISRLEQIWEPKVLVQLGFKYINPLEVPNVQEMYKQKLLDYKKEMGYKSIKYLNLLISQGLLSQEEVIGLLGGQKITIEQGIMPTMITETNMPVQSSINTEVGFNVS